jgi:hypothetical protein
MLLRLAAMLIIAAGIGLAQCDIESGARASRHRADVVFRGTVFEFRYSAKGEQLAVFRVTRVWKGPVTEMFGMLAIQSDSETFGFRYGPLKRGNELLVFGSADGTRKGNEHPYLNMPCASKLVTDAKDIGQLGRGRKPKSKSLDWRAGGELK